MKNKSLLPITMTVGFLFILLSHLYGSHMRRHLSSSLRASSLSPLSSTSSSSSSLSSSSSFLKDVKAAERCVLYDRPPRTGSTTISAALDTCLRRKGYARLPATPRHGRDNVISDMLRKQGGFRASVRAHLVLSHRDVVNMQRVCKRFLYVSSTSMMERRLLSQVKYGLFQGHGNQSIEAGRLVSSVGNRDADALREQEEFLEAYPYAVVGARSHEVAEEERLEPHYVIRQRYLVDDVRALLQVLQCEGVPLTSDNVHSVVGVGIADAPVNERGTRNGADDDLARVGVDDDVRSVADDSDSLFEQLRANVSRSMQRGDFRHQKLDALAKSHNIFGLLHARNF